MSSKKIVEQWVAKYGNNPEVDKIVNERVKYMTNNSKSMTAVEWLAEKYNYITWMRNRDEMSPETADKLRQDYFEQAKQMEKEQIMMAIKDSWYMAKGSNFQEPQEEQYYNETYGSKGSVFLEGYEQIDQNNPVTRGSTALVKKEEQKKLITEIMEEDAKNGMYDQHKEQWKGWISMKKIEEMKKRDEDKIKVTVKKDSPAADIIKAAKAEKQAAKKAIESGKINLQEIPKEQLEQERNPNYKYFDIDNKPQSVITWLINELIQNRLMALRYDADNTFDEIYKKAKQMEKEQLNIARLDGINLANKGYGK